MLACITSQINTGQKLGAGRFAKVDKATIGCSFGAFVAVKMLKALHEGNLFKDLSEVFANEVGAWSLLAHRNVIRHVCTVSQCRRAVSLYAGDTWGRGQASQGCLHAAAL